MYYILHILHKENLPPMDRGLFLTPCIHSHPESDEATLMGIRNTSEASTAFEILCVRVGK